MRRINDDWIYLLEFTSTELERQISFLVDPVDVGADASVALRTPVSALHCPRIYTNQLVFKYQWTALISLALRFMTKICFLGCDTNTYNSVPIKYWRHSISVFVMFAAFWVAQCGYGKVLHVMGSVMYLDCDSKTMPIKLFFLVWCQCDLT